MCWSQANSLISSAAVLNAAKALIFLLVKRVKCAKVAFFNRTVSGLRISDDLFIADCKEDRIRFIILTFFKVEIFNGFLYSFYIQTSNFKVTIYFVTKSLITPIKDVSIMAIYLRNCNSSKVLLAKISDDLKISVH